MNRLLFIIDIFSCLCDAHQLTINHVGREILTGSNTILNLVGCLLIIEIIIDGKQIVDHCDHFYDPLHNRTSKILMSHELRHGDHDRSVSALTRINTPPLDVVRARMNHRNRSRMIHAHIIFLFTKIVNMESKINNKEPVFDRLTLYITGTT